MSDTTNFNGNTNFHALELSLRQRAAHGVDFMLNYTFSKSMDDVGGFRLVDNPRLDRSLSVTDQPENLTGTVVYASPYGKGKMQSTNFLVRELVSDWNLSGIFTYHSGGVVSFSGSGCAGTPMGSCEPTVVPGVNPRTLDYAHPPGGVVAAPGYANTYTVIHHLNPTAFTVLDATNVTPTNAQQIIVGQGAAAYVVGTAARTGADNVWGMGTYNIDLGLKRLFPIYESVTLQFEADMLNATNHVIWGGPGGGVGSGNMVFGPNGTFTGTSTFGELGGVGNAPRDFQMAARLNW
jgi:hypothetical protein